MYFSKRKKELITAPHGQALATFLLGLLVASLMFLPSIIMGEGYFIFYGDFNVQQIPFYMNCHEAVKSGNINWSFTTDLGSNFIGAYSFYLLGSPFFWLTIPFSTSVVPYLMGPLLILKFACAALTAYLYIRRFTMTPYAARNGALLYAFSSFSIYNIFFNHFHEAIIVFPLLLLSLELLWTENRTGVFALCVALCAVVNYFFFVGMVIFCIIYWVVKLISGAFKFKFSRFLILCLESIIGVALAAFILLPSILMIAENGRVNEFQAGWGGILYGKEQIYFQILQSLFFPPDIPAHPVFVPHLGVKWSSIAAWLPVIGTSAVFGFCISKNKHWLKRVLYIMAFMAAVPVLNSAFYAFNDSYYARWYYMPVLLMCLASAFAFENDSIDWKKGWRISTIITVAIALVVGFFPQTQDSKWILGLYTDAGEKDNVYLYRFLISVSIAVICAIICRGIIALRANKKRMLSVLTAVICIVSIIYGGVFIYSGQSHSSPIKETMIDRLIEQNVNLPEETQNYRIDVYGGTDNTGMYLGVPTINAFHSVVSTSIMDFYEYIGVERNVASRPDTSYVSLRSLLSVRYLLNPTNGKAFIDESGITKMPDYNYITTSGGYYIYENESYIPYGFSYDYYITENECALLFDGSERADIMLKALVVPKDIDPSLLTSMKHFDVEELDFKQNSDAFITEEPLEESVYEYEVSLDTDYATLYMDSLHLSESAASEFSYDNNGFYATVQRDKPSLVFFSVPYDEGWSVTVNGQEAEIIKANVGFMAVPVGEGTSEISFKYTTPGLANGIKISLAALVVFAIYLLTALIIKKYVKKDEVYPEGDELLAYWCGEQSKQNENLLDIAEDDYLDSGKLEDQEPIYDSGFHIDLSNFDSEPKEEPQEE